MGWARIDDSLHDHPKMLGLSLEALGLWVKCLAWAHRHHDSDTPGFLPLDIVKSFAGRRHAKLSAELVGRQLWDAPDGNLPSAAACEVGDKSEISRSYLGDKSEISPGWYIHNYIDYLPASEKPGKAADVSKARSEAGKAGAEARWGKRKQDSERSTEDGNLPSRVDSPDPTRPDPNQAIYESKEPGDTDVRDEPRSRAYSIDVWKLARRYTSVVKLSDPGKVCAVVLNATGAGYTEDQIAPALDRLAAVGMPVSADSLRIEIDGMTRTRAPTNGHRPSTADQRVADALNLAQRLAAKEAAAEAQTRLEIGQ